MGPILYVMSVSSLFNLSNLSNIADNNFALKCHVFKQIELNQMKDNLEIIIKWLNESGQKVNGNKTEWC